MRRSKDGQDHRVQIYFDASAELVVNDLSQSVSWERPEIEGVTAMRMGSYEQPVLLVAADDRRIDWGYLYLAAPNGPGAQSIIARAQSVRGAFQRNRNGGGLPNNDLARAPIAVADGQPVMAIAFDLGKVSAQSVSRYVMLAYDDLLSVEYFGRKLQPFWRRGGLKAEGLLRSAASDFPQLKRRCFEFDQQLMEDLRQVGGRRYAQLCALAYRQALAAHKLVAGPDDARPLLMSKECFSNGCMATVDVAYPASPMFMLLDNELLKAMIRPVLEYAASERWPWPFAPHDLGRYPKANGQVYGGGEKTLDRQMPVEECGNMLIMAAAVCLVDGDVQFAEPYWPLLDQWAQYLKDKGLDPENQLCTDDFAGHLAHNVNLSLKSIVALGAYARICKRAGREKQASQFRQTSEEFAKQWQTMADDGDHFRLAFDKEGTWSQKYNLVWDRLLDLNLFPVDVAQKEVAYYLTKLNAYGLPLDNRETYTKLDWEVWTATLADSHADFLTLMEPVYKFVDETPDRVPLSDWYWTTDGRKRGFQARSVVGGLFIKALSSREIWNKWSRPTNLDK